MWKKQSPKRSLSIVISVVSITMVVSSAILISSSASHVPPTNDFGLEIELITLRPAGFEPSEITRSKGAFVLFLDDRSGKENSSLVLQRLNGEKLRAINLERKKSNWNDVVNLAPGTYILQDGSNAQSSCQITILP